MATARDMTRRSGRHTVVMPRSTQNTSVICAHHPRTLRRAVAEVCPHSVASISVRRHPPAMQVTSSCRRRRVSRAFLVTVHPGLLEESDCLAAINFPQVGLAEQPTDSSPLVTPTIKSPAPTTEQDHHQKDDHPSFHVSFTSITSLHATVGPKRSLVDLGPLEGPRRELHSGLPGVRPSPTTVQ